MNFFIDIETIPNPRIRPELLPVFDPEEVKTGNMTDEKKIHDKIEKERKEFEEDLVKKMSLDGTLFQIISVGWALTDHEGEVLERGVKMGTGGDAGILEWLKLTWEKISTSGLACRLVTWNGKSFDIPQIQRRGWVSGIKVFKDLGELIHPYNDRKSLDLKYLWHPEGKDRLEQACKALDIPAKTGMNGSEVFGFWKKKRMKKIEEYSHEEISVLIGVYKRIYFWEDEKVEQKEKEKEKFQKESRTKEAVHEAF